MLPEQRKSSRKIFKAKALLAVDGKGTNAGRTSDVGLDGISAGFPDPVEAGAMGYIRFDMLVDGKPVTITARCKVMYCIFSQGDFKVGFQFLHLDEQATGALTRFLR